MSRASLQCGLLGLLVGMAATAGSRWQPLEQTIEIHRQKQGIPGVAAAVVENGRTVWSGGFGNLTTRSRVSIASITKTMGAVLAMQEVERGGLMLEDPAPGVKGAMVKHLLSHSSAGARAGQSFRYDNKRYGLMTGVIEGRANASIAELLQERIFAPAGMVNTRPGKTVVGGVVSTVEDLARYAAALDSNKLLQEASKTRMWTPLNAKLPYGYGWFVQMLSGQKVVWHYGRVAGSSSLIVKIPARRLSLVVLANSPALGSAFHLANVALSPVGISFLDTGGLAVDEDAADLLERRPDDPEAILLAGRYYLRTGRSEFALVTFERLPLQPVRRHWAAQAVYRELAEIYRCSNPGLARRYQSAGSAGKAVARKSGKRRR